MIIRLRPSLQEVERCILDTKMEAIQYSKECGMFLEQYGDEHLLFPGNQPIIDAASKSDYEDEFVEEDNEEINAEQDSVSSQDAITLNNGLENLIRCFKRRYYFVSTVQRFCLAELSSSPISKEAKRKDNTPVPT